MKNIRYQTDESGKRVAVVVPIEQWERLIDTKNGQKKNGNSKKKSSREFYGSMNLDNKNSSFLNLKGKLKGDDNKLNDFLDHVRDSRNEWERL